MRRFSHLWHMEGFQGWEQVVVVVVVCVCVCCSQGALNRMEAIEPETFLHQCFEVTKVASTKFPPRITVLAWHRQPIHRIKEMTTAR